MTVFMHRRCLEPIWRRWSWVRGGRCGWWRRSGRRIGRYRNNVVVIVLVSFTVTS